MIRIIMTLSMMQKEMLLNTKCYMPPKNDIVT